MYRLCLILALLIGASEVVEAQKLGAPHYQVREIERLIERDESAHLVTGYELGEVYWSQRAIRTLGVGTHTILSPTGGWGQRDLQRLAVENAQQKIERLSVEIFKNSLETSRCDWKLHSRMFHAQSPLWLSDGSIHLPVMIRFEIFEACRDRLSVPSNKGQLDWLTQLEETHFSSRRSIVFAKVSSNQVSLSPLACLSHNVEIGWRVTSDSTLGTRKLPQKKWSAVRWFLAPSNEGASHETKPTQFGMSDQGSLYEAVRPLAHLGEVICQGTPQSGLNQWSTPVVDQGTDQLLRESLNSENGVELWLWLDRPR